LKTNFYQLNYSAFIADDAVIGFWAIIVSKFNNYISFKNWRQHNIFTVVFREAIYSALLKDPDKKL